MRAESREQRAESREQGTESRERRAENREQRTENREQTHRSLIFLMVRGNGAKAAGSRRFSAVISSP
ncbi:MAG: hypothetical protein EI684_14065 [Candidatus Viridilinea halotolerans]|uniref:Uncharacterized protein n=1 Tax=Candidatus Viridilinea halotolerans TaxID=2491704 RepID=A0A426TWP4_9CHLR|nr:MAG: hypothetical protein EI684_14065 [Candidatus Viridilinea halotolerans]